MIRFLFISLALFISPKSLAIGDFLDLGVRTVAERVVCEAGASISFEIEIYNVGTKEYKASDGGLLYVEAAQENVLLTIMLTENILPGESFFIELDDVFNISTNTNVIFFLEVPGDDIFVTELNNAFTQFLSYEPLPTNVDFKYSLEGIDCSQNGYLVDFQIKNLTCDTFEQGYIFKVKLFTGFPFMDILTESITLPQAMMPNDTLLFSRAIESELEKLTIVFGSLSSDDEQIVFDEYSDSFFPPWRNNNEAFSIFCDNEEEVSNIFVAKLNKVASGDYIYEWQGESYFFAGGGRDDFDYEPAGGLEDEWIYEAGDEKGLISASLESCVDLSEMNDPILSFDLVQFIDDANPNSDIPTTALNIAWIGEETGSASFHGQEEGVKEHYDVSLPSNFEGLLSIQFLNNTGVKSFRADFLDYDVNLIDNIILKDMMVSTDEVEPLALSIYPNPVIDRLYIKDQSNSIKAFSIFTLDGKLVKENINPLNGCDVNGLHPGFYYLKTMDSANNSGVLRFIKI